MDKEMNRATAIYDKWRSLGFLEGLSLKNQIALANAYEHTACKLLADAKVPSEIEDRKYNDEVDTIVFPILREIITIDPTNDLNDEFVNGVLEKTLELTESSVYDGINDLHITGMDPKAELLKLFVKKNYGIMKEIEKIMELVKQFSNNFELGAAVREHIRELEKNGSDE
jgi:hypothetical protein